MKSKPRKPETATSGFTPFTSGTSKDKESTNPQGQGQEKSTDSGSKETGENQNAPNAVAKQGSPTANSPKDLDVSVGDGEFAKTYTMNDRKTPYGTFSAKVGFSATKETVDPDADPKADPGSSETSLKLFNLGFENKTTEDNVANSISLSLSNLEHSGELWPGVKLTFSTEQLSLEMEKQFDLTLFSISAEISGEIGKEQLAGTPFNTPEISKLVDMGFKLKVAGKLTYSVGPEEVKRMKDLWKAKNELKPLLDKLDEAWKEFDKIKESRLKAIKAQTDKALKKLPKKQRRAMKKALREAVKKYDEALKVAKKTLEKAKRAAEPVLKKMIKSGRGMKTIVGKVALKTGLKVVTKTILRFIPVLNVILLIVDIVTLIADIITFIRFKDVLSSSGEGEAPGLFDEVPEEKGVEGATGDNKKKGGKGLDKKKGEKGESDASANEKGEKSDLEANASKDGESKSDVVGSGDQKEGEKGENPEGTEESGVNSEIAKAEESETGTGTDPENLTGTGDKEKEVENESSSAEKSESDKKHETEGKGKEEEKVKPNQGSGSNSGGKTEKEDQNKGSHYDVTGVELKETPAHVPSTDIQTKMIFPKNLVAGKDAVVTVEGTIISTGETFTLKNVRIRVLAITNGRVSYECPIDQEFVINEEKTLFYIKGTKGTRSL